MKNQYLFTATAMYGIIVVIMGIMSPEIVYGADKSPEIVMLEQLEEAYPSHEKIEAILEAAPFLHDQHAVMNLLTTYGNLIKPIQRILINA